MHHSSPLDGLLEVCDQLREIQDQSARGAILSEDALRQARLRVATVQEQVFPSLPGLKQNPKAANLEPPALLILALLFHRRLSGGNDALSGAHLCSLLLRAGYPRSQALHLLGPSGPLRQGDWLLCEVPRQGFDPLDSYFHPSPDALQLFGPPSSATPPAPTPPAQQPQPFADETEYLWEIGRWRQICGQRADALFESDPLHNLCSPRLQHLRHTAHAQWVRLRQRLALTPGAREFGLERLASTFKLGQDHILILAHLLFAEILDGEFYMAPGECLRLVSGHRDDLLHKRKLVSPQGRLRREGIILADNEESAKMLAVPLCLADWVLDQVLAKVGRSPKWNPQELEDFLRDENER